MADIVSQTTSQLAMKIMERAILLEFCKEVHERAKPHVTDAHWNAMRQVLAEKGIDITSENQHSSE